MCHCSFLLLINVNLHLSTSSTVTHTDTRSSLAVHSFHTENTNKLSTWLFYALSRLRSRRRCRPHRHPIRHQPHPRFPPLRESVAAKTTVCSVPRPNHGWILLSSKMMTSTRHPRTQRRRQRQRRRAGGLAASVKSSLNERECLCMV